MIRYFANIRLPTEKAHGIQIMEMCRAFKQQNQEVILYAADRVRIKQDPFGYYGFTEKFPIKYLPVIDLLSITAPKLFKDVAFLIEQLSFAISSIFVNTSKSDLIYTREKIIVIVFGLFHAQNPVIYESHDSATGSLPDKLAAKYAKSVVSITKSIESSWKKLGVKTIYAPDGVSEQFFNSLTKDDSRKQLQLPFDKKIVVYTGSLYEWKGVDTLLEAMAGLPDILLYIVGEAPLDRFIKLTKKYHDESNIHFVGHQPYPTIPVWIKAADVLVVPTSAATKKGKEDTSPLKLFEYLASGVPMVVADVPSIIEVVSKEEIITFTPDDTQSLKDSIKLLFNTNNQQVENNRFAEQYAWKHRVEEILKKI